MEEDKQPSFPVFRQSIFEPIINTTVIPLILVWMFANIFKNSYFALLLFLVLLSAIALICFLEYTTIYIGNNGMVVKNKLRSTEIAWDNVVSMSTVYNLSRFLRYQIKTGDYTLSIPMPKNWEDFEKLVVSKARLEMEGENEALALKINSPGIKRWKKIGGEYVNTSVSDRILGMGYVNKRTWAARATLGVILFIMGIVGALLLYLLDTGFKL
ncbi:MAG: hypothetical protein Q8N84_01335 [bacterium]|nr:hypothetical protein [bacterium]